MTKIRTNSERELIPEEGLPEIHPMQALLDSEDFGLETPKRGEIRVGVIAHLAPGDMLVDIGAKSEGIIPAHELDKIPSSDLEDLQLGQEITVYVISSGDRDGNIILSILRAEEEKDWERAEGLLDQEENFTSQVSGYNKGGLIVKLGRLRGFVPGSQVSLTRRRRSQGETPEERWGEMIDEPIVVRVIEVDRRRNRLILSEREASREARDLIKERLISELSPGEIRTGHVISLADFGAFVDIGGADGLVHTSELSWKRVTDPSEVLKVGQEIQVKVLDLDPERKRISLSLREMEDDPWDEIAEQFQEGQLVEGLITKITKFGAFAQLAETPDYEVEGLIHISELAEHRVEHPGEVVQEGETLALRIINVEPERRRIGLSLRKVDSPEYADADWESALGDLSDEPPEEDFDAELELEGEDVAPELEPDDGQVG